MISEINRSRFRLVGRDKIAHALATGTMQTLGINENEKTQAIEWVQQQDAQRAAALQLDSNRFETIRRWTIVAAVASVVAAIAAVIGLFR